jgi:hypothetical protein
MEMAYIANNTFSSAEIKEMIRKIWETLEYVLSNPTSKTFLRRFMKAAGEETGNFANLAHVSLFD